MNINRHSAFLAISLSIIAFAAGASDVGILNQFISETPAVAEEVNENFTTIETAVNDNFSEITTLKQSDISGEFGDDTESASAGTGGDCTMGQVWLVAGIVASGVPAQGQILQIGSNSALFSLMGTLYGGDGRVTFGLPDLTEAAPNGLTYVICLTGIYPSRT
ncbi:MAG: hypothetical protein ACJAZT_001680 [Gammaproteobacteria bacterium]|jgi:hypothetical protein